jgi:ankyrin repeat protein
LTFPSPSSPASSSPPALWESVRDFNETDVRGRSLLYVAARSADPSAVKRALNHVNVETSLGRTRGGKTALFAAARGGNAEIVEILAKRADTKPDARTDDGRTAMWTACYHGHLEAAKVLRRAVDADATSPDDAGVTPLLAAAATGSDACIRFLLSGHCDLPRRMDSEVVESSLGIAPLFAACVDGDLNAALSLLLAGAKVDAENRHGRTPLMAAAMCGHDDVCLALMTRGADPNRADTGGETALHLAIAAFGAADDGNSSGNSSGAGAIATICAFRCGDVEANAVDTDGFTPLLAACWHGDVRAVEALITAVAPRRLDLDLAATKEGRTALHAACWRGHVQCAAALLDAGADVDITDADGRTALWSACRAGHEQCAGLCLERGADVFINDAAGTSPLFAAAFGGDACTIETLLRHGADPHVKDSHGRACVDLFMDDDDAYNSPIAVLLRDPNASSTSTTQRAKHESRLNRAAHDALVSSRRAAMHSVVDEELVDSHQMSLGDAIDAMDEAQRAWSEAR